MRPQLLSLLQAFSRNRLDLKLSSFSESQIRWGITTGLGSLLLHATKTDREASASPIWPLLRGADLAAQVLAMEYLDAMAEIIDVCAGQTAALTLLKGISICREYYPITHLRAMRDLDFLVESGDFATINSLLVTLGYRQRYKHLTTFYERHHHDMPWFHPRKGIWVEVHRCLFPPDSKLGRSVAFSTRNIGAELRPSYFDGRQVMRLSAELQIIYTTSHWAQKLRGEGGLFGLLDVVCLLSGTGQALKWQRILDCVQGSIVATHLYLLLSYLQQNEIIDLDAAILTELFKAQPSFGRFNLRIAHFLIERCLLEGKFPEGRAAARNLDILWKSLLLDHGALRNLLSIPWNIFLPLYIRKSIFN
jgi:hypothetical protein